jgi:hypothetical protein
LWLRDLFPHAKYSTRILSYEYDCESLVKPGGLADSSIYTEAISLVNHLVADRESEDAERRPLIFLCHGYGGILLKRALAYSHSRKDVKLEHLRSIYRSTTGIIFVATPHHGLKKSTLLLSHRHIRHGPSQFTLNLIEGSEALQEVSDQFAPLVKDFRIYNFWELEKTVFSGDASAYVVERSSAAPAWDVDQCGIKATHADILRFKTRSSPGYRLVLAALEKYVKAAPRDAQRRWEQDCQLIQEEREHEAPGLLSAGRRYPVDRPISPFSTALLAQSSSSFPEPDVTPSSSNESLPTKNPESSGSATPPDVNVHYLVRRRSEYFVGRRAQTEQLQEKFGIIQPTKRRKPKVFVIYGLPGSGKTQFCLRYLEERRHMLVVASSIAIVRIKR